MISVHFQGKPFNITVIQVYAPTSNAEKADVERFFEDLQDLICFLCFYVGEKTGCSERSLALGRLLGENMAKALLLVSDLASPGDPVPLCSGLSCFHLRHDVPRYKRPEEQEPPQQLPS